MRGCARALQWVAGGGGARRLQRLAAAPAAGVGAAEEAEVAERQVWVDFNDCDERGLTSTLARFAAPGVDLSVGARVLAGDHEGNLCWAEVRAHEPGGLVLLALDTAAPVEQPRTPARPAPPARAAG